MEFKSEHSRENHISHQVTELLKKAGIEDPAPEQKQFLERAASGLIMDPENTADITNGYVLWFCNEKGLRPITEEDSFTIDSAIRVEDGVATEAHGFALAINLRKELTYEQEDMRFGENKHLKRFTGLAGLITWKINKDKIRKASGLFGRYTAPISIAGSDKPEIIKTENRHVLATAEYLDSNVHKALIPRGCKIHTIPFTHLELKNMVDPSRDVSHKKESKAKIEGDNGNMIPEPVIYEKNTSRLHSFIVNSGVNIRGFTPESVAKAGVRSSAGYLFENIVMKEMQNPAFQERLKKVLGGDVELLDIFSPESEEINIAFASFAHNTLLRNPDRVLVGKRGDQYVILAPVEVKAGRLRTVSNAQLQKFSDTITAFIKAVNNKIVMSRGRGALLNGNLKISKISSNQENRVIMIRPRETTEDSLEPKRGLAEDRNPVYVIESGFTIEEIESYLYDIYLGKINN